jgi:hypothetical protein
MKRKGRCFETMPDIQRESQAVLDSIKENGFHGAFGAWEKRWDRCILSQETILKAMVAKIEQVKSAFLFLLIRKLSDTPRYIFVGRYVAREVKEGLKLQRTALGKLGRGRIKTCESNIKRALKKISFFSNRIRINWLTIGHDFVQVGLNILLSIKIVKFSRC